MAPLFGMGPIPKYNSDKVERVQRQAARFVKSWYSSYSSVSVVLGGGRLFLKRRQEARLNLFYKIINGFGTSALRRRNNLDGSCGILNQNQDVYIFNNFDFICI